MTLHSQPLFTWEMERDELRMAGGATYLHGASAVEERGDLAAEWVAEKATDGVKFVAVIEGDETVEFFDGRSSDAAFLNNQTELIAALSKLGTPLYLDITSVTHSTWAPIVRASILAGIELRVIYLEPASYRRSSSPSPGLIFDLSERIGGIAPLPGFARVPGPTTESAIFVPMLGFEGARFSFIRENVQAADDKTFPIVGVPGFRAEYPFNAFAGNKVPLDGQVGRNVHLAKANCPFDAFHEIHRIHRAFPDVQLKLAPIGTKPHALGAVLYALAHPATVELVYDHPVRSQKRTVGEARLCLYDVSGFARSSLFLGRGEFAGAA